jgi:hypothetical protein
VNLVYLVMNRALDKLIVMHKQNRQNLGHARRYSSNLDQGLDKAFEELAKYETVLEALGDDEQIADVLALGSKEYETVEKELQKDNPEGESSYRYRILPRIYSNLEKIDSSPQLARKLISYYLRNRRKEKMYRLYGRINRHSSRVMADHLVHEMYMELGRTLYFSWISKIKEYIKAKIININVLRTMRGAVEKIKELGSELIERLVQINVEKWLAGLLAGGVGVAVYLILKSFGLYEVLGGLKGYLDEKVVDFITGVFSLITVVAAGLKAYFIFRNIITNYRIILRPKALLTFVKGYKLLISFAKAFSKLWGNMGVNDLIDILGKFVKAAKDGDDASIEELSKRIDEIVDKINSDKSYAEFFTTLNQEQIRRLRNAQEEGEKLMVKFEAQVMANFGEIIKEEFDVPPFITSDYFDFTKGVSSELSVQDGEGQKQLPIELAMLLIITSPNITIKLSAGKVQAPITFKAWSFIKTHGGVTTKDVEGFLEVYMRAFAKKRYELSKYLMGKFEEKVKLEKQSQ